MEPNPCCTDTAAQERHQTTEKPYKLFDERGLYLWSTQTARAGGVSNTAHGGKEKLLSLGVYPDVTLKRARDKRDEARKLIADGIDPSAERQAEKAARADTFEAIAREWLAMQTRLERRHAGSRSGAP